MIKFFVKYFKWSNKNFSDNPNGRFYITRTGRLNVIIIFYIILLFSWLIFLFPPFPLTAKVILFTAFVLFSLFVIFLSDFRILKIIRLYKLSKKTDNSVCCKIVYDTFLNGLSKQMKSNLYKNFTNYKLISNNSLSIKLFITYANKKYKIIFTTHKVIIIDSKKIKINDKAITIDELFSKIVEKIKP